jgi:hypothetical protein
MKLSKKLAGLTIGFLVLVGATDAFAATTVGRVTFLGTLNEEASNGVFGAQFRIRVFGTCDGDSVAKSRFIHVRAGRMDGAFAHNATNARNAYSTLLAASLAGKTVQIDGMANCSTTVPIDLPLWTGNVGLIN